MKNKERVSIFVDGGNFYHSTQKRGWKINYRKLINELVRGRNLVGAYYYVAPLDLDTNQERYWKHQRFLDMLKEIPKF
ncbi:MAG: NYN domain-containing protein [Nanoarchaeota archaeon]|nr:NYN domain-containing protein [Nanoarchaeota archaeon]